MDIEKEVEIYFKDWDKNTYGALFDEKGCKVGIAHIKRVAKYFYSLGQKSK